jgi:hypothetical protein
MYNRSAFQKGKTGSIFNFTIPDSVVSGPWSFGVFYGSFRDLGHLVMGWFIMGRFVTMSTW